MNIRLSTAFIIKCVLFLVSLSILYLIVANLNKPALGQQYPCTVGLRVNGQDVFNQVSVSPTAQVRTLIVCNFQISSVTWYGTNNGTPIAPSSLPSNVFNGSNYWISDAYSVPQGTYTRQAQVNGHISSSTLTITSGSAGGGQQATPPTASLTGPTTGQVGQPVNFNANAFGVRLTGIEIYVSPNSGAQFTKIGSNLGCGYSPNCAVGANWNPPTPGQYYVVINAYSDSNGDSQSNGTNENCSTNPFSLTAGWGNCNFHAHLITVGQQATPPSTILTQSPTSGALGQSLQFAATANGNRLTGVDIYVSPTNVQNFVQIASNRNCGYSSTCSVNGSYNFPNGPGQYYIVTNAYTDSNGDSQANGNNENCSNNPFTLTAGWGNCNSGPGTVTIAQVANPPSATVTGQNNATVGQPINFTGTATSNGATIKQIGLWAVRVVNGQISGGWEAFDTPEFSPKQCGTQSCSIQGSWTPTETEAGDWYVVVNAWDSRDTNSSPLTKCSGSPTRDPNIWSDCGSQDLIHLHIAADVQADPPTLTSFSVPSNGQVGQPLTVSAAAQSDSTNPITQMGIWARKHGSSTWEAFDNHPIQCGTPNCTASSTWVPADSEAGTWDIAVNVWTQDQINCSTSPERNPNIWRGDCSMPGFKTITISSPPPPEGCTLGEDLGDCSDSVKSARLRCVLDPDGTGTTEECIPTACLNGGSLPDCTAPLQSCTDQYGVVHPHNSTWTCAEDTGNGLAYGTQSCNNGATSDCNLTSCENGSTPPHCNPQPPTVDITIDGQLYGDNGQITVNEDTVHNLSWITTNVPDNGCTVSGDWNLPSTTVDDEGTVSTGPLDGPRTYTYSITCRGEGSQLSQNSLGDFFIKTAKAQALTDTDTVTVVVTGSTAPLCSPSDPDTTENANKHTQHTQQCGSRCHYGIFACSDNSDPREYLDDTGFCSLPANNPHCRVAPSVTSLTVSVGGQTIPENGQVNTGQVVSVKATVPAELGEDYACLWDYGDGTFDADPTDCEGLNVTHIYNTPGTYTVKVRAATPYDVSNPRTQTIRVGAVAPTVDLKIDNQLAGKNGQITATHDSPHTLSWDTTNVPTEGCSASGDWGNFGSGFTLNQGNVPTGPLSGPKTYTYTITCSNANGSGSDTDSVTVVIESPTPTISSFHATNFAGGRSLPDGGQISTGTTAIFNVSVPSYLGNDYACFWDSGSMPLYEENGRRINAGDTHECNNVRGTFNNAGTHGVSVFIGNSRGQISSTKELTFTVVNSTSTNICDGHQVGETWDGTCKSDGIRETFSCVDGTPNPTIQSGQRNDNACRTGQCLNDSDCDGNKTCNVATKTCVEAGRAQITNIQTDFGSGSVDYGENASFIANTNLSHQDYNCFWSVNNSEFKNIGLSSNNCHMTIQTLQRNGFKIGSNSIKAKLLDERTRAEDTKEVTFTISNPPAGNITGVTVRNFNSGAIISPNEAGIYEVESQTKLTLQANVQSPHPDYYCRWNYNNDGDTGPDHPGSKCFFDVTPVAGAGTSEFPVTVSTLDSFNQSSNRIEFRLRATSPGPADNCPVPGGYISCGSYGSSAAYNPNCGAGSTNANARGHCSAGYGLLCSSPVRRMSIDIPAAAGTQVYLPAINDGGTLKQVTWNYVPGESFTVAAGDGGGYGKVFTAQLGGITWKLRLLHVNSNLIKTSGQSGEAVVTVANTQAQCKGCFNHAHVNIAKNGNWLAPDENQGMCTGRNRALQEAGQLVIDPTQEESHDNDYLGEEIIETAITPTSTPTNSPTTTPVNSKPEIRVTIDPANIEGRQIDSGTNVSFNVTLVRGQSNTRCHWNFNGESQDAYTQSCTSYSSDFNYEDAANGQVVLSVYPEDSNGKGNTVTTRFSIKAPSAVSQCTDQRDDRVAIQACVTAVNRGVRKTLTIRNGQGLTRTATVPLGPFMNCVMKEESWGGNTCTLQLGQSGGPSIHGYTGVFQYDATTWGISNQAAAGANEGRMTLTADGKVIQGAVNGNNRCWGNPGPDHSTFSSAFGPNIDKGVWNPYRQILATKDFIEKGEARRWPNTGYNCLAPGLYE